MEIESFNIKSLFNRFNLPEELGEDLMGYFGPECEYYKESLCFIAPVSLIYAYISRSYLWYKDKGFIIYHGLKDKEDALFIMKGNDCLEILNLEDLQQDRHKELKSPYSTQKLKSTYSTKAFQSKIKNLQQKYGFLLTGASSKHIEGTFENLPINIEEFTHEVYDAFPEMHHIYGTKDSFMDILNCSSMVYVKWD